MADETLPPKCVSCFLAWGEHDVCTCGPLQGKPTPLESLAEENERLRKALRSRGFPSTRESHQEAHDDA